MEALKNLYAPAPFIMYFLYLVCRFISQRVAGALCLMTGPVSALRPRHVYQRAPSSPHLPKRFSSPSLGCCRQLQRRMLGSVVFSTHLERSPEFSWNVLPKYWFLFIVEHAWNNVDMHVLKLSSGNVRLYLCALVCCVSHWKVYFCWSYLKSSAATREEMRTF